jgi:hypothetical protein
VDDGLGFGELRDREGAAQAAHAALLVTALGEAVVDGRLCVRPDGAGLDFSADAAADVDVQVISLSYLKHQVMRKVVKLELTGHEPRDTREAWTRILLLTPFFGLTPLDSSSPRGLGWDLNIQAKNHVRKVDQDDCF